MDVRVTLGADRNGKPAFLSTPGHEITQCHEIFSFPGRIGTWPAGPPQRIHDMGAQHLPGEKVWVIGEYRSTGERKYYLSNLPADTPIKELAGAIKARWVCEQVHQ